MNNNEHRDELILWGIDKSRLEISELVVSERRDLINQAQQVTAVNDGVSQSLAVSTLGHLKGLVKRLEKAREYVKRPVLEIGRLIDTKVREFCDPVQGEINRIDRLVSAFQEVERKKQEDIRRYQEERRQQAAEEERKRQAELDRKLEKAKTESKRSELLAKKQESEEQFHTAVLDTVAEENRAAPVRASGMIVRETWKHEVISIEELFKARPECVKLVPNDPVIRGLLSAGVREIPGVRIWKETKTSARAI